LLLNGVPVTIVGVTPRGFEGATIGVSADVTIAVATLPRVQPSMAELSSPGNFWLHALARAAGSLRPAEAAARLNAIWPALADSVISSRWPASRRQAMAQLIFVLEPGARGWTYLRDIYQKPLLVLQAVAALVLLIACANVASLFLARASTRRREIAVRLAIGAGRGRIVRQLLIEGLLLSFAGAIVGIGVAWVSSRFLLELMSTGPLPATLDLTPNGHVLFFSIALATVTGAVFGIAPALHTRHTGPALALKDDARTAAKRSPVLPSLVSAQVAVSLVLVAGAGLFVQTLRNLQHVNTGFTSDGVLVVQLDRDLQPPPEALLDTVRHVPGVLTAAIATHTPLNGSSWSEAIVPAGQTMPEVDNARLIGVGPDFFAALQIAVVAGREIAATDVAGHAGVAIVNEKYAARHFPNQNPIGQRLVSNLMGKPADLEIVGVVRDTIASGLRRQTSAIVYVSLDQFGRQHSPSLVIRTSGASGVTSEAVRTALQAALPTRLIEVRSLSAQVNGTIVQERLMATLAGSFGVLALVLSSVGLYGLLAYSVARRSREIGIRMALGANRAVVVRRVLLNGLGLVAIGVLVGYPATWAASRSVSSMLFGLTPTDLTTMAIAIGLLAAAALVASYVPARRASRVDPLVALRHE
jgi:predicted permease